MQDNLAIGLDFDNTIVSYDRLLGDIVNELGWLEGVTGKRAIRDALRLSRYGDEGWQQLQGMIYGPRMIEADIMPGVSEFLDVAKKSGAVVYIISHKTEFALADKSRTPLRQVALDWMEKEGFFIDYGISPGNVHFNSTKSQKIACIQQAGVSLFVDDLEEILTDKNFPRGVRKILFSPDGHAPSGQYEVFGCFDSLRREIFGA